MKTIVIISFLLISHIVYSQIPTNGLVAYYPFTGNANDERGNENNGIVNSATLTTDRFDNPNSAYEFDGIDDYITIANSPELVFGANDFTIVAWIYPTTLDGSQGFTIITKHNSDDGSWGYRVANNSSTGYIPKISFGIAYPVVESYANTTVSLNSWQMVVIKRSGVNFDFYFNDQNDGSFISDKELTSIFSVIISGQGNIYSQRFIGKIDDVRIYNRALNNSEISSIYQSGGWSSLNNGLVAFYPFNGNANDESGNENNGIVNSATLTTDRFDNANSAYEFDGIDDYITIANSPELVFGANDFTIVAWIYPTAWNGAWGYNAIITKSISDDGLWCFRIRETSGNFPKINFSYGFPVVEFYANTFIPLSTWQMVAIRRNGINFDFFLNDQYDGNFTSDKELSTLSPVMISGQVNISNERFTGKIDDIRIYNRALDLQEITSLYIEGQQWNCGDSIIDLRDSQSYSTVQIDTQCWMGENQNIGTMIQGTNTMTDNSIIEKYCYNNDPVNCTTFGGLYQWNEMMQYTTQQQVQGICALGWHIPTDVEWTTLSTFLGGESVTGGKLKETGTTHWNPPNTGATNESGFTAIPGGFLYNVNYNALGDNIFFQTSTSSNNNDAWSRTLSYNIASLVREGYSKNYGFSVRCIKDIPSPPSLPSNPQPPNGSIDQPQNTTLSWTCTDPDNDPLIYDVYFGVTNPPALVSSGQTITTYNPGSLNYSITYYWKIDAIDDDDNISEGQIWTFSTEGCADIAVIPDTFNLSLYGTNNSITLPLTIYNTGQCDLIWEIDTSTSINYTLQFDGSNDYVNIGQSFGDFSEFTIEFLRKSTGYGTSNWPRMVTGWRNQPYNGSNDGFTIEHSASDQNAVSIWFSPDGTNNSVGTFSVSQNSWNHIALTFDGSLAKIYFDGNEVGQQSYSPGMITTLNNIQFGGDQPTGRYFNGQLDEIRLWNYALSETSIQQKMFSSISSPIQGLVGSWNFNEGSETSVNDQSGFNRNGTIFGANWIQSDLLLSSNGFTSFDIYSGVITPGSSSTVNVTFSSSGLTAGTYIEFININSNDTQNPVVTIPVNLVVYDSVHVVASAEPSDICVGESVQLDATASGGYGNYSYSWTSDPPGFNSSLQNPVVAPTTNTTYYVEVSDGFDSDTGSVLVSVFLTEPPSMVENMLPPDSSIIPQPIITFSWQPAENASFYDLYVWEAIAPPPSQPVDSNITSIQYTYNNLNYATSYKWKLIAKNPCFQTESQIQSFEVAELPDLIVTDIQVPANPMTGQEIQISCTTFNQGNYETQTTNWHDAIYLSHDSIPNTSVDTYLGSFPKLTSLSPNTGYNQLVSITL
ncbi:MAG: hypothetical protein K8S16_09245, partial [Bacteroidales bacterium]|nr:hypothetical protein [Bacteroidales bacterium]